MMADPIYYYVTNEACGNIRLYFSLEEAKAERSFFIDVFDKDGKKVLCYQKKILENGEIEYEAKAVI